MINLLARTGPESATQETRYIVLKNTQFSTCAINLSSCRRRIFLRKENNVEREQYQQIRDSALKEREKVKNVLWKEALIRLASAANALDAMEARIEENVKNVRGNKE